MPPFPARRPVYYGWVMLVLAAAAMAGTLPGRTIGLETITEPILADPRLGLTADDLSWLNFWAVVLGAVLCLPVGWLIDRVGVRLVLAGVAAGLGLSALWLTAAADQRTFFLALLLVRGLGQGALSVVALAMVGKWFTRRLGVAMGVFTVLLTFGIIGGYTGLKEAVAASGWRPAWQGLGWVLLAGLAPLGLLLARSTPETIGLPADAPTDPADEARPALDLPWRTALGSSAFWVFTLTAALFNLMLSAITLFAERLLTARGFPAEGKTQAIELMLGVMTFAGLPTNLLGGWLAGRVALGRLMAVGMAALAGALLVFPFVADVGSAAGFGALLGVSGGLVTVVFFAVYGTGYGRTNLGVIQSAAQVVTVLASAVGPVLLTRTERTFGSFDPLFFVAGAVALGLTIASWRTKLPDRGKQP
ncbi:MAG TPA: MFS transporter [Fimbriiglobus sp.]|nr:MFS transporter [Fimbriiglobus sp.]